MKYDSYADWYDNGPGSEAFKREVRGSNLKHFPNLPGFPFYKEEKQWPEIKIKLEEELFEI